MIAFGCDQQQQKGSEQSHCGGLQVQSLVTKEAGKRNDKNKQAFFEQVRIEDFVIFVARHKLGLQSCIG